MIKNNKACQQYDLSNRGEEERTKQIFYDREREREGRLKNQLPGKLSMLLGNQLINAFVAMVN